MLSSVRFLFCSKNKLWNLKLVTTKRKKAKRNWIIFMARFSTDHHLRRRLTVGILLSNEKADRISSPRNLEHLVAVMNGTSGLKVSKDKENSILPVSNRPFVASDSDDFHSETRSKFFGRFRKPKVSISECRWKFGVS